MKKTKRKKSVLIYGGSGVVGEILTKGMLERYEITVADIKVPAYDGRFDFLKTDIRSLDEVHRCLTSRHIDAIINLVGLPKQKSIVDAEMFIKMNDTYLNGAQNVLSTAIAIGIQKYVFGSTNRITGVLEKDGNSLLNEEINSNTKPAADSVYAALKLCAEQIGNLYSDIYDLSVINIRIGTVRLEESSAIMNKRFKKTILYHDDAVQLFTCTVEAGLKNGTYYGVSDNKGRPWSIKEAIKDIGYLPQRRF